MPDPPAAPGLLTRLVARLGGEVSAEVLESYRRAGLGVYDLFTQAEARRAEAEGTPEHAPDEASRCFLLCAWNGFALQTIGDAFVDADYAAQPRTVGFVPPITKEQALAFYGDVEAWIGRGRQAEADPAFEMPIALPAELPPFVKVEPCPTEHLKAMLAAARTLRSHGETAILDAERVGGATPEQLASLRALLASAASAADYAERLYGDGGASQETHERIEASLQESLRSFYLAGQLAAMPELVGRRTIPASVTGAGRRLPGPGEPGFDAWCLTDPRSRERWQRDRKARAAIDSLWELDPEPRATLDMQAEIDASLAAGFVAYATGRDGRRLGNYFCCPWSAVYETTQAVTIAGRRLRSGQQFVADVSAEELAEGGEFKRELLLGNFRPTDRIDYCDPAAGGHDD